MMEVEVESSNIVEEFEKFELSVRYIRIMCKKSLNVKSIEGISVVQCLIVVSTNQLVCELRCSTCSSLVKL